MSFTRDLMGRYSIGRGGGCFPITASEGGHATKPVRGGGGGEPALPDLLTYTAVSHGAFSPSINVELLHPRPFIGSSAHWCRPSGIKYQRKQVRQL